MSRRLSALSTLCLGFALLVPGAVRAQTAAPCAARVDQVTVDATSFDHYNLRVRTVFLGSDGEYTFSVHTPESAERKVHQGTLRCTPDHNGNPVWVTLDFGPCAAYSAKPGTRKFVGTWSGEKISGTW